MVKRIKITQVANRFTSASKTDIIFTDETALHSAQYRGFLRDQMGKDSANICLISRYYLFGEEMGYKNDKI